MRRPILLAALAAAGLVVSLAHATVIPVDFERSVGSEVLVDDGAGLFDVDVDIISSSTEGGFDDTSMAAAETIGAIGSSTALQASTITATSVVATGSFTTSAETSSAEASATAIGSSQVVYRFEVTTETTFVLTGTMEATGGGGALVFLVSDDDRPVEIRVAGGAFELDETGTLAPGAYVFELGTSGSAVTFPDEISATGAFDVSFELAATVGVPSGDVAVHPISVRPNPTRGAVTFTVDGSVSGARIFDADGRLVRVLDLAPTKRVTWDGRRTDGAPAAAGVYFVRLSNGASARVTLLR
jgi:hypothetical protein